MARPNPIYRPQPVSGPQAPTPIVPANMPARDLVSPTLASTQVPVTAPTMPTCGPTDNPYVAATTPWSQPLTPGPAAQASAPTWTWTPTPSPNQTLDSADRAAVSGNPGYAGPVPVNATSQMQDMRGVGQTRQDVPGVPDDTSQG